MNTAACIPCRAVGMEVKVRHVFVVVLYASTGIERSHPDHLATDHDDLVTEDGRGGTGPGVGNGANPVVQWPVAKS